MHHIDNPYTHLFQARVLHYLKQGIIPWRQGFSPHGVARTYQDNRSISGISWLLCNFTTPYPLPYYLNWKQLKTMGGTVQKNTKAEFIYYQKGEKWQRFPIYNIGCIEGITIQEPVLQQEKAIFQKIDTWAAPLLHAIPNEPTLWQVPKWNPLKDTVKLPAQKVPSTTYYWHLFKALLTYLTDASEEQPIPHLLLYYPYASQQQQLTCELGATYLCGYFGLFTPPIIKDNDSEILDWQYHVYRYPEMLLASILEMRQLVNLLFEKQRLHFSTLLSDY